MFSYFFEMSEVTSQCTSMNTALFIQ